MQVRNGMSKVVLTVGPGHTLREAARLMADRRVGAAVVLDPESPGPGILTERDLLDSIGRARIPTRSASRTTSRPTSSSPPRTGRSRRPRSRWCVAASATSSSSTGGEVAGLLSMRDIVRCWTDDGAICDVPASAPFGAAA